MLYLDTSALVKLYVQEAFSDEMVKLAASSKAVASHVIAFAEANAAFAAALRDGRLDDDAHAKMKRDFRAHWLDIIQINVSMPLLERASDLAEAFSLRAYDSVHLAAAELLQRQTGEDVLFACFDNRLNRAAKIIDLRLPDFLGA